MVLRAHGENLHKMDAMKGMLVHGKMATDPDWLQTFWCPGKAIPWRLLGFGSPSDFVRNFLNALSFFLFYSSRFCILHLQFSVLNIFSFLRHFHRGD